MAGLRERSAVKRKDLWGPPEKLGFVGSTAELLRQLWKSHAAGQPSAAGTVEVGGRDARDGDSSQRLSLVAPFPPASSSGPK